MKTLDELYQQMLKRAADGKPVVVSTLMCKLL